MRCVQGKLKNATGAATAMINNSLRDPSLDLGCSQQPQAQAEGSAQPAAGGKWWFRLSSLSPDGGL